VGYLGCIATSIHRGPPHTQQHISKESTSIHSKPR
jgi:hypothetical protein